MTYHTIPVRISGREMKRLEEYSQQKDMSMSAVMRQALRVYGMMEQTPGAYDAVRPLTCLGPKMAPEDAALEQPAQETRADQPRCVCGRAYEYHHPLPSNGACNGYRPSANR